MQWLLGYVRAKAFCDCRLVWVSGGRVCWAMLGLGYPVVWLG